MNAVATVLVEFHKSQCYFVSAIQVASIFINVQQDPRLRTISETDNLPVFPLSLGLAFTMNGVVPIAFSLCTIAKYARLSWHIVLLSLITMTLSTLGLGFVTDMFRDDVLNGMFSPKSGPMNSLKVGGWDGKAGWDGKSQSRYRLPLSSKSE